MSYKSADRVQVTTQTNGAGSLFLGNAISKMRTPANAGFVDGDTFWGLIEHLELSEYELTLCTYRDSGGQVFIDRDDTPIASSTGSKVDFSQGNKIVSCVRPASTGMEPFVLKTSGFTAIPQMGYDIDTTDGPVECLIPPGSVDGNKFYFNDYASTFATNKFTVNPGIFEFEDPGVSVDPTLPMECDENGVTFFLLLSAGKLRPRFQVG